MKALYLDNRCWLTKWLLIIALLCSLLACLGGDITSHDGLPISAKRELALVTKPTVKQAPPVRASQGSGTFYTPIRASQFTALMVCNALVSIQLKLVRFTGFNIKRFACLLPIKTIPASDGEPFLAHLEADTSYQSPAVASHFPFLLTTTGR